ncbi:MAG: hypothetical protein AABY22_13750 [Nanoarchaeota archaeon]
MAKRNSYVKKTFGKTFNIFDLILLIILIGYTRYYLKNFGGVAFLIELSGEIFYVLISLFILNFFLKRVRR